MLSFLKAWREQRVLRKHRITDADWRAAVSELDCLGHLPETELERLRDLASLFLYDKSIETTQGFEMDAIMRARVAGQAVLPVLNLGLDCYRNWYSVIVYPDAFISRDVYQDEAGVLHTTPEARSGEAWGRGPVILSWQDVIAGQPGYNVIIHEMAHKLDLLDGVANGFPPLWSGMRAQDWTDAFSAAYEALQARIQTGRSAPIDDYAGTSPAEFFAVASEAFFETPRALQDAWPDVYDQLVLYYRQRP